MEGFHTAKAPLPIATRRRADIWTHVDLRGFRFTPRITSFDWRLLHGLDPDQVVRLALHTAPRAAAPTAPLWSTAVKHASLLCTHPCLQHPPLCHLNIVALPQVRRCDTPALEAVLPALQRGDVFAEPAAGLSSHNHVQVFRLVQLAVEWLWQLRDCHVRLYAAYAAAQDAAYR